MITPGHLKAGDRVALVAPAGKVDEKVIERAVGVLGSWGLEVQPGKHLLKGHFSYSAPDDDRLEDIQSALDDTSIKAILCSRGGYGTVRIIDRLDFGTFRRRPKWIIGFSDITVLHSHVNGRVGVETIHGGMAAAIGEKGPALETLRSVLFGESLRYSLETHSLSRTGSTTGRLTGGNLAILASLSGSISDIRTKGRVLLIEEVGEHLYRIDRMMWTLKRAGKLRDLAGLVAGSMTEIPDTAGEFGKDAYGIIREHVSGYDYPVCFGFPSGHQHDNRAMIMGRKVTLRIGTTTEVSF